MKLPFTLVLLWITAVFMSGCGQSSDQSSAGEAQPRARLPIIDMHMHVFDAVLLPDGTPIPLPCEPQPCEGVAAVAKSDDAILQITLEQMDKYNVVKALVSSDNRSKLERWVTADPDRFVPSLLIWEPGKPGADTLRAEYSEGRLSGFMGEIATQYYGFAPNAPELAEYFALAEELDLPVLIHTLGIGQHRPGFRVALGNPLLLEDVMVRHPNLRLYVEDAGYPFLAEMVAMMYQYPQLHADLSTITWLIPRDAFHDYVRALMRAGLGKRLMFGSDQVLWPEAIGRGIEAIESADYLTAEQRRDIFYNNAARFLRLDEESAID